MERRSLEPYFVPELNSTSPSTGEFGELVEDLENDDLNKDTVDDEDAVEDILYMRGASFTIHLDPPPENSTTNSTKINEETSPAFDRVELRATSQVKGNLLFFQGNPRDGNAARLGTVSDINGSVHAISRFM